MLGAIDVIAWNVERGVKPCGSLFIGLGDEDVIIAYLKEYHPTVSYLVKRGVTASELYIYKLPHMKIVIENIPNISSPIYHWYMGKMYGISDWEIYKFMMGDGEDDN